MYEGCGCQLGRTEQVVQVHAELYLNQLWDQVAKPQSETHLMVDVAEVVLGPLVHLHAVYRKKLTNSFIIKKLYYHILTNLYY